jgi:hypothetical protein
MCTKIAAPMSRANQPPSAKRRGAPLINAAPARVRIPIYLTSDQRDALRTVATANHRPMTAVIREAVNEFVADYGERAVFLRLTNRQPE